MIITIAQFKNMIAAGAGLVIDASSLTPPQLRDLVTAAAAAQTQLAIKNVSGFTPDHLAQLAAMAPKLLTFDLT
jgi:hypothetical protein